MLRASFGGNKSLLFALFGAFAAIAVRFEFQ